MYGRIPLLSSSFLVYTVTLSLSLLITAFFYPSCYLLFALMSFSSPSIPSSILSSFAFGLVFVSALTLLLNYASLKPAPKPLQLLLFITMQFLSSLVTRSMIVAASLSSFLVRAVMHAFPFLFAFRLLSLSAILLLLGIVSLLLVLTRSPVSSSPPDITSSTSPSKAIPSRTTPKPLASSPASTTSLSSARTRTAAAPTSSAHHPPLLLAYLPHAPPT